MYRAIIIFQNQSISKHALSVTRQQQKEIECKKDL